MLLICVSLKLSQDRTRALVYSHGVGAGRRTSTTVSGHGSTETLNYDLTPEDFHRNIWSTGALPMHFPGLDLPF